LDNNKFWNFKNSKNNKKQFYKV